MEHFPQASWWSSRGWPGQLKGPQNEHEESGRISGIWKQLSTFTNWQMQEQFVVATTLWPRRYRARHLECTIQGPIARQDADEAERARWIQVLADMLKATRTSMGQLLSTSTKLLRGGRTVSTLLSRVRVLRRFLSLLALNHQQVYPLSWLQLTEYFRVKLEEPCSGAGLKNTHQAHIQFPGRGGWCIFRAALHELSVILRGPSGVARLTLPWSPFEAGPETSGGGPRHSSALEDVCLVVASPSLGHAQGQRPPRHQASRRAASRPQARSHSDKVQDNRGRPKPDVQKACCVVLSSANWGQLMSMANFPRDYLLQAPATHFHGCRKKKLEYDQEEGREIT